MSFFTSLLNILQKLRTWRNASDQQPIARSCGGDIEQLALGGVDVVEFHFVGDLGQMGGRWETVEVFFHRCIDKGLISPDRASNKTDIAYLYYLPFAMGFVSNDKLHKRVAPLFTGPEQHFIGGQALRDDMVVLDDYFWSLPAEQREQGLFKLASRPPDDDRFLTTRLWRQFRVPVVPPQPRAGKDEQLHESLLRQVRELKAHAARGVPAGLRPTDISDPDQLVMERAIPLRRGKWRILPPGTESAAQ